MQNDRTRRDEYPYPDEELERSPRRGWEELEDAAVHPGDPAIYPPLEEEEEEEEE